MNKNIVKFSIDNCLNCSNCYTESIWTEDSFEHEEGAYCKIIEDKRTGYFGYNGKHKLIGFDDWHLEQYTEIPDWCPLLDKNKGEGT